ncbi:RHS repeat domain-containing protein, partial [Pseudomonas sp. 21(2023)]
MTFRKNACKVYCSASISSLQARSVSQQDRNLFHRHYAYDANGNLAGVNDSRKGNRSYHYDPLDRLINVRGSTPESFAHD